MPDRQTEEAVAQAAPLETARRAAGARGAGSHDPRLDAVAAGIELICRELDV